jgi:dienelactone hydrolase
MDMRSLLLALLVAAPALADPPVGSLPGTKPLERDDELDVRMMDGLHRFIERKLEESVGGRKEDWKRDFTSQEAYEKSVQPNRERLKKVLGIVDPRVRVRMERWGDDDNPALVADAKTYRVWQARWPVLDDVSGAGLLLEPKEKPIACVIALPDADQTPEQLAGLAHGVALESQFARRLAENGFLVVVPVLIDRDDRFSGNPDVAWTNQPHREWIYRQAYHLGRHPIGFEVQKVLAAVDWCKEKHGNAMKVGVAGYGEGGLVAFHAAACDPRVDACFVSGYFEAHRKPWEEPLYRNIWGLRYFGDAEVASLIAPRGLVVEYSHMPVVEGPPAVREGRRGGAAGRLLTPAFADVEGEWKRLAELVPNNFQSRHLAHDATKAVHFGTPDAVRKFAALLGSDRALPLTENRPENTRKRFDPVARMEQQVRELERFVQRLVRGSDRTREQFFTPNLFAQSGKLEPFTEETKKLRKYLREEVIGSFNIIPALPLPVRSRQNYDRPKWSGHEVVIEVDRDLIAWGVLLLPKDIKEGEQRPVVVCQHGRNGLPRDVIERDHRAYHDYAAKLADRGFIVFAPHNPYRGEERYRFLSRKANSVRTSLFSFILAQHEAILLWLRNLPQVDPKRIAFYGLSYGGETAVRIPPLLDGYCLSICSADFNDWARKVASTDAKYSFMFTIEWEMPYWNMGSTFNYTEMVDLMLPRPFMVERGHNDGVAPDEWVLYEYAKVKRRYDLFGIGDRTAIEVFNGVHEIKGEGTFEFLHRHLNWPKK